MQPCIPQPSCAELKAGQVLCTARGATGGLSWSLYNGTAWSKFANLATSTVSAPSCTSDHSGGVICAVFTSAEATLVNRFNGTAWEGFLNLGGIAGGNPDCTFFTTVDPVVCFAKAIGDSIFVTVFDGGNWVMGSWTTYGNLGGEVNDNASCTSQATGELVCGVIGQPTPATLFTPTSLTDQAGRAGPLSAAAEPGLARPPARRWARAK
jgi:hypothetical protein